jgi:hypothetical protein
MVAQLYPLAQGSLYIVSYNSQGYGGGILTLPYLEGQVPVYPISGLLNCTVNHVVWT